MGSKSIGPFVKQGNPIPQFITTALFCSMLCSPEITIKNIGPFTSKTFELKEGDKLWFRGPYGKGYLALDRQY